MNFGRLSRTDDASPLHLASPRRALRAGAPSSVDNDDAAGESDETNQAAATPAGSATAGDKCRPGVSKSSDEGQNRKQQKKQTPPKKDNKDNKKKTDGDDDDEEGSKKKDKKPTPWQEGALRVVNILGSLVSQARGSCNISDIEPIPAQGTLEDLLAVLDARTLTPSCVNPIRFEDPWCGMFSRNRRRTRRTRLSDLSRRHERLLANRDSPYGAGHRGGRTQDRESCAGPIAASRRDVPQAGRLSTLPYARPAVQPAGSKKPTLQPGARATQPTAFTPNRPSRLLSDLASKAKLRPRRSSHSIGSGSTESVSEQGIFGLPFDSCAGLF